MIARPFSLVADEWSDEIKFLTNGLMKSHEIGLTLDLSASLKT